MSVGAIGHNFIGIFILLVFIIVLVFLFYDTRLKEGEKPDRAKFAPFGSKFRYSGRTQFQSRNSDYGRSTGPIVNRKDNGRLFKRDSPNTTLDRGEKS